MRFTSRTTKFGSLAMASAALLVPLAANHGPAQAAEALAPVNQVFYQMNEPAEATTALDSSGNGLNALIDQSGLDTGVTYDGSTGYFWPRKGPNALPVAPERIVQVPDNPLLDPAGDTFTVEIRYRTKENFGNIIQKGQSASKGGQWKIQNPRGMPSCLFKSPTGRAGVRSSINLSDNEWHTLTCVREPSRVTMYIDGVYHNRRNAASGTIDNTIPMTIGGKINCDQVVITCDYFSGNIDYVKITRGS
ncbi:MAG: LamG-like jellyroll fold domain-containing protein [Nocardioides sp.]